MTTTYDIGDVRRLSVTFTDINDADADPATVTFRMRSPDGTVLVYVYGTDPEVKKTAVGIYYVEHEFAGPGRHVLRWEGAGTIVVAEETEYYIRRSEVPV